MSGSVAARVTSPSALTRSSAIVSVSLLGGAAGAFVLQALAAATFGAGPALDAYYLGAAIPMVLVSAFAAGLVFIVAPLVRDGDDRAGPHRRALPAASLVVVAGFSVVVATTSSVFAEPIIGLLGGSLDSAAQSLAARVLAIQAWSPSLIAVAVWLSAHLVTSGRPALASSAPVVGNAVAILVFALARGTGDATWIAWAVVLGAAAQVAFAAAAIRFSGVAVRRPVPTRQATRHAASLVLPWLAAAALYKSHALIDRVVGSWDHPGAVTSLALGLTVATVAASTLTRGIGLALSPKLGHGAPAPGRDLWNGICAAVLLLAPAVCILVTLRLEVVTLLFGRGQFSAADVSSTAATLVPYSVVLAALGMGNVITTTFYALGDTHTPAKVGVAGLGVHGAVTLALWPVAGYLAAGWGFAAMSVTSLAVLGTLLRRRLGPLAPPGSLAHALRPAAVAVALVPLLVGARAWLAARAPGGDPWTSLWVMTATVPYLAAYVGALAALGRTRPGTG